MERAVGSGGEGEKTYDLNLAGREGKRERERVSSRMPPSSFRLSSWKKTELPFIETGKSKGRANWGN